MVAGRPRHYLIQGPGWSYWGAGGLPTSTMNWFLSAGKTVTVTRIGFPVWSKDV